MNGGGRVEIDTAKLETFAHRLADRLTADCKTGPRIQAEQTAAQIRGGVPHRSGRLAGSVTTTTAAGGYAVLYGSGVPYARYIEHRTHTVQSAVESGSVLYRHAMTALAQKEVRRA